MAEMRNLLSFMDKEDRERALERYEELFARVGPDREEALIASFGSALRQVLTLEKEYRQAQKNGVTPFTDPLPTPAELAEAPFVSQPKEEPAAEAEPAEDLSSAPENAASFVRDAASALGENDTDPEVSADAIHPMDEEFPMERLIPPGEPPLKTSEVVFPEVVFGMPEEEAGEETAQAPSDEDIPEPEKDEEPVGAPEEPAAEEPREESPSAEADEAETAPLLPAEAEALFPPEPTKEETEPPAGAEAEDRTTREPPERPAETKKSRSPGAGRIFAAILVTFPFLLLWIASFAVFIALGLAVMAVGLVCCTAGVYFVGYVTHGGLSFMPDLLLVAGAALVCFALALLFIWMGLWIAVGGCAGVIRWTSSVYRKILRKKIPRKGGDQ